MAYTVFQAGSTLQLMNESGTITSLTLPADVTLDPSKPARFAVFGRYVVVVNSASRPIIVDADGVVRVLTPNSPSVGPVLSAAAGGTLTGTYRVKQSYVTFDASRRVINESPMSPASNSQAVAAQWLKAASLELSRDTISAIRLYRTTTGGSTYFPWVDLDGNTQTSTQDDLSDASLDDVAAPVLGAPPRLTMVGEFRERLWGVSGTEIDNLRYTESQKMYSWPSTNVFQIPKIGSDSRGITGILPRREALAIGKVNALVQVTGNTASDFRVVKLSQEVGVEAPDSIAQFRDMIFFLWKDGVYEWSSDGIRCISDGHVRSWFTTNSYFNQSRFQYAVGRIDPGRNKYQLFLSNAGSTALDRWIEYDLKNGTWWGPHKTDDFTMTWSGVVYDSNKVVIPVIGSSAGFFYKEQATRTDGTATGIALDVDGKFHDMGTPDIEKFFDMPSFVSKIQAAGTLVVTPKVGGLDAAAGSTISVDMTLGRQRVERLGAGRYAQLNFTHSTAGQDVELYGYELPFFELGRR